MKRVTLSRPRWCWRCIAVLATRVAAQETNTQIKRSILTFSAPVELPGVTLEAGTYVFRLADTPRATWSRVPQGGQKSLATTMGQWTFVSGRANTVSDEAGHHVQGSP